LATDFCARTRKIEKQILYGIRPPAGWNDRIRKKRCSSGAGAFIEKNRDMQNACPLAINRVLAILQ
jgi:hypothetical protein